MNFSEGFIDALYSALRDRDVRLTWTELEDSLKVASGEDVPVEPVYEYGLRDAREEQFIYGRWASLEVLKRNAEQTGDILVRRIRSGEWEEVPND